VETTTTTTITEQYISMVKMQSCGFKKKLKIHSGVVSARSVVNVDKVRKSASVMVPEGPGQSSCVAWKRFSLESSAVFEA